MSGTFRRRSENISSSDLPLVVLGRESSSLIFLLAILSMDCEGLVRVIYTKVFVSFAYFILCLVGATPPGYGVQASFIFVQASSNLIVCVMMCIIIRDSY